jgi:DNA (cytosine-5)-methyltransferase 1
MKKYSDIRKVFNIKPDKDSDNKYAILTHILQNSFSETNLNGLRSKYVQIKNSLTNLKIDTNKIEWDITFKPNTNNNFSFIDLFAGIGGFRIAFQNLGGKCVFSSEYNKFAKITYEKNFGEVPFDDITKIDENLIPEHDILLGGFPCQPFSIAGVSKKTSLGMEHGFLDKTQGTLFFDIARIIKRKRPKAFLLENVKNLKSHDSGKTFKIILETLSKLNYVLFYDILDGKYYVPQHRERIFIVGFNRDYYNDFINFGFPKSAIINRKFKDILEKQPENKYTLSDHLWSYLQKYAQKHKSLGNGFGFGLTDPEGISRTLSARYYKDGSEILISQNGKNPRRLTPRECARLQGFPDFFEIPVSDNQAYRQFGNSVVVPLVQSVGNEIIKVL